jgi:membrane-associated phospholipid phosphatase
MPAHAGIGQSPNYFSRFFTLVQMSLTQLVRPPSHSRRAEAARRLARHAVLFTAVGGVMIIALMYALDAREIVLMPHRGTAILWPVRILTDFGKPAYVLWSLAGMLFAVAVVSPGLRGTSRSHLLGLGSSHLLGLGIRLQFLLFAVLVPVLTGEIIKWIVGRGRPFVGGEADVFNFVHFAGTEAYASFPSSHAITSAALAVAVSAVWPQARVPMIVYAVLIAMSRLVLLAHHPSDVVAGALIGVVGAMVARYWFAARRLGFAIGPDGTIVPLAASPRLRKRVAREPSAP